MATIILGNRTTLPDGPIRAALSWASRRLGVTGRIAVKVTQAQYALFPGRAQYHERTWPYRRTLFGPKCRDPERLVTSRGGWITICIGRPRRIGKGESHELLIAENFVNTAMHEFAHAKQAQDCRTNQLRSLRTASGRRVAWHHRPIEIDAMNQVDDRRARTQKQVEKYENLILELAIALEDQVL